MNWPQWDSDLFKFINQIHSSEFDQLMIFFSNKYVWIPLYLFLIFLLIKKYNKSAWKGILYLILSVAASDQISSSILKPLFKRPRPCHNADFQSWIHLADGCGGAFGFCSSHAANSFALAIGFYLLTKNKIWLYVLFTWAIIISYSRIALGAHYPLDVLIGGIIGVSMAVLLSLRIKD